MGSFRIFESGRPGAADILVCAILHPFPPCHGSGVRIAQYIRYLAGLGLGVDLAVLSDLTSEAKVAEHAQAALEHCRKVVVVRHPISSSRLARLAYSAWGRMVGFRVGDWLRCPGRFPRAIHRALGRGHYRAVIISGLHLAALTRIFHPPVLRILEAQDVWFDRYQSFAALGRGAELANFADPGREARLVQRFDQVLALMERDASIFRSIGVTRPIAVVPFVADAELMGLSGVGAGEPPARPPRILFVGSEGSNNLDGIRFFRTRVLPLVRRQVPTCRFRVVGKAAGQLDAGGGVDLVGWCDRLADEYRQAAAVVVPLRMGSGLKTKTVEALAHGKALISTTIGVQGIDLVPGRDAAVSDDPAVLAQETIRILQDDGVRQSFEENARALAARLFDPHTAFQPLRQILDLEMKPERIRAGAAIPGAARGSP